MTRHLTNDELQQFRARALEPQRLLQADRHLATCEECRRGVRQVGSAPSLPELAPLADGPLHPSYDELSAFVDGMESLTEADRARVELHVTVCSSCATELQDLRAFDARLAQESSVDTSSATESNSFFARLQAWLRGPEGSAYGNARFALSTAALLAVGIGLMAEVQLSHPGNLASQVGSNGTTAAPANEFEFYAGLAVLVVSLAGIVYRSRK